MLLAELLVILNLFMAFDDRAQIAANPREDELPSRAYRALSDPHVRSIFRQDNTGPRSYELWSLYFEADTTQEVTDIRNDLNAEYPGKLRTIGAWWWDGRQVGTEFTFDNDGVITGTSGIPRFPLHTSILEFMPDIVMRDQDGNEISRVRPTELSDVNLLQGQVERRFD